MKAQLQRFVDAGVTLPILTAVTEPDRVADLFEALAP